MEKVTVEFLGGGPLDGRKDSYLKEDLSQRKGTISYSGSYPISSDKPFIHLYKFKSAMNTNNWGWLYTFRYEGTEDL